MRRRQSCAVWQRFYHPMKKSAQNVFEEKVTANDIPLREARSVFSLDSI